MFPWWVRLFIFLPLATLQIILITMKVMGWQYEVGFEQFMVVLGDFVSWALRLEIIEAVIRDVLAGWNIVLPELGKHWHHVFVILWLFMGSFARLLGSGESPLVATGLFILAGFCSFVSAFAAGTMLVGSGAVLLWPFAGFFAFFVIFALLEGNWRAALQVAAIAAAVVALGYFFNPAGEGTGALVVLAAVVGIMGLMFIVFGLFEDVGDFRSRLQAPGTAFGFDIIGPFAAAATAAWAFGKYIPI
jgi:hypothetical protein